VEGEIQIKEDNMKFDLTKVAQVAVIWLAFLFTLVAVAIVFNAFIAPGPPHWHLLPHGHFFARLFIICFAFVFSIAVVAIAYKALTASAPPPPHEQQGHQPPPPPN